MKTDKKNIGEKNKENMSFEKENMRKAMKNMISTKKNAERKGKDIMDEKMLKNDTDDTKAIARYIGKKALFAIANSYEYAFMDEAFDFPESEKDRRMSIFLTEMVLGRKLRDDEAIDYEKDGVGFLIVLDSPDEDAVRTVDEVLGFKKKIGMDNGDAGKCDGTGKGADTRRDMVNAEKGEGAEKGIEIDFVANPTMDTKNTGRKKDTNEKGQANKTNKNIINAFLRITSVEDSIMAEYAAAAGIRAKQDADTWVRSNTERIDTADDTVDGDTQESGNKNGEKRNNFFRPYNAMIRDFAKYAAELIVGRKLRESEGIRETGKIRCTMDVPENIAVYELIERDGIRYLRKNPHNWETFSVKVTIRVVSRLIEITENAATDLSNEI